MEKIELCKSLRSLHILYRCFGMKINQIIFFTLSEKLCLYSLTSLADISIKTLINLKGVLEI